MAIVICGLISLIPLFFAARIFRTALVANAQGEDSFARSELRAGALPLTITAFGRSSDTISARVAFGTPAGDPVSTFERSWSGWELTLDCVIVGTGKGWLVFPFSLSTDASGPGRGVNLLRYYDDKGFPAIYESAELNQGDRLALRRLFSIVRTERWIPRFLGALHHETVTLRSFKAGTVYTLAVTSAGSLLLR